MATENGYNDLLRAARALVAFESLARIEGKLTDDQMREFCTANAVPLESAHTALGGACFADYGESTRGLDQFSEDAQVIYPLAQSLAWQAKLLANRGDMEGSSKVAFNIMRLGNALRHQARIVEMLTAVGFSQWGINRLRIIRNALSPGVCAKLARELIALDAAREPFAAILERDVQWEQALAEEEANRGPRTADSVLEPPEGYDAESFAELLRLLDEYMKVPPAERAIPHQESDRRDRATTRLLAADLALRAYRHQAGSFPADLSALVPAYLPDVPGDPYCDAPLRYRSDGTQFTLYSVGQSGQDKGGHFGNALDVLAGRADLSLDYFDFPIVCEAGDCGSEADVS